MAKSVGSKSTMKMQPETTYAETLPDPSKTTIAMEIIWAEKTVPLKSLKPYERNPRRITKEAFDRLKNRISRLGYHQRIICQPDGGVIGGHVRLRALKELGHKDVKVLIPNRALSDEEFREALISDNGQFGEWDMDMLSADFEIEELIEWGVPEALVDGYQNGAGSEGEAEQARGNLAEKFLIAPFSVFNAREGWWQERKRAWIARGIRSEAGRGDNLLKFSDTVKMKKSESIAKTFGAEENISDQTGTSIFDPVLCEVAYRWFCPPGGSVLDPFAGGSVRGAVAAMLGRHYTGVDLRQEQVDANKAQAAAMQLDPTPDWRVGDSRSIFQIAKGEAFDFLFSCPPYADLERYSDDPKDLSTLKYAEFLKAYREIIGASIKLLKPDRFACFVVGEVRGKKDGAYYNFVGDTVRAFIDGGMQFYNEAILVTAVGSLAMRVNKQFTGSRKLGKTHQNVLLFVKGDAKKATAAIGEVEFAEEQSAGAELGEQL